MLSFSTQKQSISSNTNEEFIYIMTIRMLKKICLSEDKNRICLDNQNIQLIQVMARVQHIQVDVDKASIFINDDTGMTNIQFLIQTQIDNENYQKLRKGKIQNEYFLFLFRGRIYRLMPLLDIVNVQQIKQSSFIYFHYLNLIQQNLNNVLKNPIVKQDCSSKQTLKQFEQNIQPLEQRIMQYLLRSREFDKSVQFSLQIIINQFIETDRLTNIKDAISNLIKQEKIRQNETDKLYFIV